MTTTTTATTTTPVTTTDSLKNSYTELLQVDCSSTILTSKESG